MIALAPRLSVAIMIACLVARAPAAPADGAARATANSPGSPGLHLEIVDADTGQPVPGCVYLKDATGKAAEPRGLPFWRDHFACAGTAQLPLAPGEYRYEIDRGPEYLVTRGTVRIARDGPTRLKCELHRLVDLTREGWWSGELHIHRPLPDIELLLRAADLHVAPVITWWNTRNEWHDRPLPSQPLVRFDGDRYYQALAGEDERGGGALLFFNLRQPLDLTQATREYPSAAQFRDEASRAGAWIDIEKPFWWDVPVWLASGRADSIGLANNHLLRNGVIEHEAWGRPRDRQRLPDPQGNGYWSQEIYYHILNCGLRLPPSAGSASGVLTNPVGYNRVYVHLGAELDYAEWWRALRAGRVFVTNGPLLRCRAGGELPGHVFQSPDGRAFTLDLDVTLDSRDPIASIQVIQNGRVVRSVTYAEWKRAGTLGTVECTESGWFLVRAIADVPETFRFASSGPFYVEWAADARRVSRTSAQFFLDWVRERMSLIKLDDPRQQAEVMKYQREAEQFWEAKVAAANAP